jgi:hypothetical protein
MVQRTPAFLEEHNTYQGKEKNFFYKQAKFEDDVSFVRTNDLYAPVRLPRYPPFAALAVTSTDQP